jgi:hypothetical protein
MGITRSFPKHKVARHEADLLPPPSAKIKAEWSSTSNSTGYLQVMLEENSTITFTLTPHIQVTGIPEPELRHKAGIRMLFQHKLCSAVVTCFTSFITMICRS